ncbi:hypothetical protein L345_16941, partial [Ophiophagus hannah]
MPTRLKSKIYKTAILTGPKALSMPWKCKGSVGYRAPPFLTTSQMTPFDNILVPAPLVWTCPESSTFHCGQDSLPTRSQRPATSRASKTEMTRKTPSTKICKPWACALEMQLTMQSGVQGSKKWTLHLWEYARNKKEEEEEEKPSPRTPSTPRIKLKYSSLYWVEKCHYRKRRRRRRRRRKRKRRKGEEEWGKKKRRGQEKK